jgi:hypothetical protein
MTIWVVGLWGRGQRFKTHIKELGLWHMMGKELFGPRGTCAPWCAFVHVPIQKRSFWITRHCC